MTARKVLLIGDDPFTATGGLGPYRFSLEDHAAAIQRAAHLELSGLITPAPALLDKARDTWGVACVGEDFAGADTPLAADIAVLLTAPELRADYVQQLHGVSTVVVEPPCGLGVADSEAFMDLCETNHLTVRVAGAWRTDPMIAKLAAEGPEAMIGPIEAVTGMYGFGLWDRGIMWIDIVSQLLGPVAMIQALEDSRPIDQPDIDGDLAVTFLMTVDLERRYGQIMATALAASDARAPSYLELIGADGRLHLTFLAEKTELRHWRPNQEGPVERADHIAALDHLYTDLDAAPSGNGLPALTIADAVGIEHLIEAILDSADHGGDRYHCR